MNRRFIGQFWGEGQTLIEPNSSDLTLSLVDCGVEMFCVELEGSDRSLDISVLREFIEKQAELGQASFEGERIHIPVLIGDVLQETLSCRTVLLNTP